MKLNLPILTCADVCVFVDDGSDENVLQVQYSNASVRTTIRYAAWREIRLSKHPRKVRNAHEVWSRTYSIPTKTHSHP